MMLVLHIVTLLTAVILFSVSTLAVEKEWTDTTSEPTLNLVHFGQKSYYIGGVFKGTYFRGQEFCRYHGMHLLSIESEEENDFLQQKLVEFGVSNERFWTSGTRLPDGVRWVWLSTGRPLVYTNWTPGEPNDARDYDEKCIEVKSTKGNLKWNDVNCTRELHFICEISWPKECHKILHEMNSSKAH